MEKISGIIPANSRHTNVDLKSSGNVRAGMPAFGREVGPSHLRNNATEREVANTAMEKHKDLMSIRDTTKNPQADLVQDLADRFFMKNKKMESPITAVNYGADADLTLSPEQMNVDLTPAEKTSENLIENELTDGSMVQAAAAKSNFKYVPLESSDTTRNQSKEPSDEAPYMGRNLDVSV
jgi:hypothetical protein